MIHRISIRRLLRSLPIHEKECIWKVPIGWSLYTLVFIIYQAGGTSCDWYIFTSENGRGTSD